MVPGGFDKNSGPGTDTSRQQIPPFGYKPPSQSPSSWTSVYPPPALTTRPSSHVSYAADLDKPASELPVPKRTRSPYSTDFGLQGNRSVLYDGDDAKRPSVRLNTRPSSQVWTPQSDDEFDKPATNLPIPKRTRSPYSTDLGLRGSNSVHDDDAKRLPYVSPPRSSIRSSSHVTPYTDLDQPASKTSVPKRTRSPYSTDSASWRNNSVHDDRKGPSVSPPRISTPVTYADLYKPPASELPLSKRSRLPFSTDLGLQGNNPVHNDTERELQAKAKRLARFRDELSQPEPSDTVNRELASVDEKGFMAETTGHLLRNSNVEADGEGQESTVISGYCPDMCPEQERAERERKGDLDQYERLDGDRNHTTEYLAVKKYTRTAEREAALIRPMKILQKTMDYLLNLLDQPYDDRLLGLYNFLWDRMRAIRMDLRMQHIFNLGAITMLEQMIRLHIVAMHELCGYTKGEGFSEGFDAHLNIEQMNKTSVELFQLYDDHRKNGIEVPTETEFRGYYALLKLDKHPGYKVEASELSLDLAKMTPGIRQASQVLFARHVARACRSGNYIAFFRLVRKASYLQACLMHAHFGKLRTQALAALHSGLQNNQGIPVIRVATWLGMEEENMEDLLDYHGFSIKEFEEPYMVKEGPFLNGDSEYPLKYSKLVHRKRSTTVVEDVLYPPVSCSTESTPPKEQHEESPLAHKENFPNAIDSSSHMTDNDSTTSAQLVVLGDSFSQDHPQLEVASHSPWDIFKTSSHSFKFPSPVSTKPNYDKRHMNGHSDIPAQYETLPDVEPVQQDPIKYVSPEPENEMATEIETDTDSSVVDDEQVAAEAKLKLILRRWRRRAFTKKDLRDRKLLAANVALSSLSLGLPTRRHEEQLEVAGDFDIDRAMCTRYEKQEQLWSRINVSNVVARTLGERYQYPTEIICWKLLFSSLDLDDQPGDPASCLQYKLMPENVTNDEVTSFPGLSIWKKWDYGTCYLSVVRNIKSGIDLLEEKVSGASAVIFLVSENISWEAQKIRLHELVSRIPSCIPLVVITTSSNEISPSIIVENLGLNELDICSYSVVQNSEENLRKALEWLASESPVPPVVGCVTARELVMSHLHFGDESSSPEQCISAVNHALDESVKQILDAAESNPASWPCPEIALLDLERPYLPSVGWSSASRIKPLIQAMNNCRLPSNSLCWTGIGGIDIVDIENQKTRIEQSLVTYLTPLMGLALAQKEASTLTQTCVGLTLHGSTHHLVPNWVSIFRRIFNWQLTGLSKTSAYILSAQHNHHHSQRFEDKSSSWFNCNYNCNMIPLPSLDEMMQVIRNPSVESDYNAVTTTAETMTSAAAGVCSPEVVENGDDEVMEEMNYVVEDERKVKERSLRRLLEQCNIVQDIIDKKLSMYF